MLRLGGIELSIPQTSVGSFAEPIRTATSVAATVVAIGVLIVRFAAGLKNTQPARVVQHRRGSQDQRGTL